ncbi:DcuS/MalK family sensor histidine kinase [Peribacillus sp. SCS-26]|uniref:DcuS/MalK family sensor histidine kinase n=1 Tax=Paraperibacillus marinus TaxID=3115295 RepID=UPI0039060BD9
MKAPSKFRLSTLIIFFICMVVLICLVITDLLISINVNDDIRESKEEKAKIVARTVAKSQIVIDGLEDGSSYSEEIQVYANDIKKATDVMFVVVMDMEGIRKSHPDPEKVGKHFIGGDEGPVLKGNEHVSFSTGTLGKSLRAFTPVYNGHREQIGAVAVGISLNHIEDALVGSQRNIMMGTVIGIVVGIMGAVILARYIKKILLGLEPYAIAKLLEERSTMLQSVHEGIVAVDHDSTITLVNKSAQQLFQRAGLTGEPVGKKISDYMPTTGLDRVLQTGKPELDEEQVINGITILVNRVPLIVGGRVAGAISTFRDKTDVNQLAEQLTGVRTYAEALRAQSHEFKNRLHVILGMVQMKFYDELREFIRSLVNHQNEEMGSVAQHVKDPALAGFIMGKMSYAREEDVRMTFHIESILPEPRDPKLTQELITILGNLVDNAIESMMSALVKELDVQLEYELGSLYIEVADSGPGIDPEIQEHIFERNVSTKGSSRGYGLYLVKNSVGQLGGELTLESPPEQGAVFRISIPYEKRGDSDDKGLNC